MPMAKYREYSASVCGAPAASRRYDGGQTGEAVFARVKISGYTMEEIKPLPMVAFMDFVHPDDLAEIERVIAESASGAIGTAYQMKYRFKRKDGQYRWCCDQFTVMRDSGGQPLAIIGSVSDITERKKAEEEKRRLEERSHKLVDDVFRFIPEGILVFSRKMELLRQNQAFRELVSGYAKRLGFAEDELENLIIDKVKAGLRDNNIKEIRITGKHGTGKQT